MKAVNGEFLYNLRIFDGCNVDVDEPCQGVLVHGVYVRQVRNAVVQNCRMLGHRSVLLSKFVNNVSCFESNLLFFLNVDRECL